MTAFASSPQFDAGIIVDDLVAARRFYVDVLGLPVLDERDYASGTQIIELGVEGSGHLKLNRPEPPPALPPPGDTHRSALGLRYVTVYVADADAAHRELTVAGFPPESEVRTSRAGRLFFVRDPVGTFVEVVQRS